MISFEMLISLWLVLGLGKLYKHWSRNNFSLILISQMFW